jgi:hypothetical protein
MSGKWKIMLSVAVILATTSVASSASAARAHCRMLPAGPEWYVDDLGCWHSIRADWAGIQRHARMRRQPSSDDGNSSSDDNK